jgi:hypothetical protein
MKIDIAELIEKYRDKARTARKRVTTRETIVRSPKRIAQRRRESPPVTGQKSGHRVPRLPARSKSDRTPTGRRGRRTR